MSFRRGACPALSTPMQTGDGLLVRLATAGAGLTPSQLIALCEAAARHGNGMVEITARGNFQIRGLTADSAATLADDVAAMDLGLRDGVPVETNPLAGLDPTETANAAPLATAIREAIDATDLVTRLGPKVSVVVDGGRTSDLSALSADVRLTALPSTDTDGGQSTCGSTPRSLATAWLISTGGDSATATPLATADDEAAATAVTLAILETIAARGPAARARDLAPSEIKAVLSSLVTGQSPVTSSPPHPAASRPPSPRWGEEGSLRHRRVPSPLGERTRAKRAGEGAQIIALTNGRFALPVALPFGSVRAADLIAFLEQVQLHSAELRLAPGRSLLLLFPSETAVATVLKAARAAGLIVDAADPRARIFACPGSAGCASGHIAAREIAAAVAREIGNDIDAEFDLHISGCPKGCAHPAPAALTLVGTESGPMLVENGTARQSGIPFGNQDIATRLAGAVRDHANSRRQSDTRRKPHPVYAFAGD